MDKKVVAEKIKELLEKNKKRNFKQSVEVGFNFKDIDMESEGKLNMSVFLPKGRGKDIEIGVFADGDMNVKAKKLSKHVLDRRGLDEYAKSKKRMRKFAEDCYGFVAQADLMPVVGKSWGVVLGTRGKMPRPVPPNADLEPILKRLKDSVRVKSKKNPIVHVPIGVEDMAPEDLCENFFTVYNAIEKQIHKDKIRSIYLKTTMGLAVKL